MAEVDGRRIATMFTADTNLEFVFGAAAFLDPHVNQLADTGLVERLERVDMQDILLEVIRQESIHVVATVAKRHLGQVIGPETEEVGVLSDFVSGQCCARNFDHGSDQNIEFASELLRYFRFLDGRFDFLQQPTTPLVF